MNPSNKDTADRRTGTEARKHELRKELEARKAERDAPNPVVRAEVAPSRGVLDTDIPWNELPVRVQHAIWHVGSLRGKSIRTYRDLVTISASELRAKRGFGKGSFETLMEHLNKLGLQMEE